MRNLDAEKLGMTDEEYQRLVQASRTSQEWSFLQAVNTYRDIGFGRMLQIVSHAWYRYLLDRGWPPGGALLANTAFDLLKGKERRDYVALCQGDPLFKLEDKATKRSWPEH